MKMPEDGRGDSTLEALVGRTIMSGIPPVEPVSGVGVERAANGVLVG